MNSLKFRTTNECQVQDLCFSNGKFTVVEKSGRNVEVPGENVMTIYKPFSKDTVDAIDKVGGFCISKLNDPNNPESYQYCIRFTCPIRGGGNGPSSMGSSDMSWATAGERASVGSRSFSGDISYSSDRAEVGSRPYDPSNFSFNYVAGQNQRTTSVPQETFDVPIIRQCDGEVVSVMRLDRPGGRVIAFGDLKPETPYTLTTSRPGAAPSTQGLGGDRNVADLAMDVAGAVSDARGGNWAGAAEKSLEVARDVIDVAGDVAGAARNVIESHAETVGKAMADGTAQNIPGGGSVW